MSTGLKPSKWNKLKCSERREQSRKMCINHKCHLLSDLLKVNMMRLEIISKPSNRMKRDTESKPNYKTSVLSAESGQTKSITKNCLLRSSR